MILSHAKIEEIAAAVIKDFNLFFFGEKASEARSMPQGTPIDQFASEYLRLKISFEKLSVDGSLCGLTAYEDTEYAIEENGVSRTISLKRNQVLLDSSFIAPGDVRKLCGKRRFTLSSLVQRGRRLKGYRQSGIRKYIQSARSVAAFHQQPFRVQRLGNLRVL